MQRQQGEIYIEPDLPKYNLKNGRFLKGHVPANKGKKWSDYMGKRAQKRAMKGWANLDKYRPHGCPGAGRNKKPVIAVSNSGKWMFFPYLGDARKWIGGNRENVARCCRSNQERHVNKKTGRINTDHRYKGVRFYFEEDTIWMQKAKMEQLNF